MDRFKNIKLSRIVASKGWLTFLFVALAGLASATPTNLFLLKSEDSISFQTIVDGTNWKSSKRFELDNRLTTLWAKFTFIPTSEKTIIDLTGYIDGFTLYYFYNNEWHTVRSTKEQSVARPMVSEMMASFTTLKDVPNTIYIKTTTRYVIPDFKVFAEEDFFLKKEKDVFRISVIIGFLLCIFIINGFYYLVDRNNLYLYYSLYVLFLAIPPLTGISLSMLGNNDLSFYPWMTYGSNFFVIVFGILYGYNFLGIGNYPTLKNIILYYLIAILVSSVLVLSIADNAGPFLHLLSLSGLVIAAAVGYYVWRKGSQFAWLFSLAYLFFSIFYLLKLASTYGLIPFNNFYFIYGALMEAVVLSYALAIKIMHEKNENKYKLQESNEHLAKQNTQLEQYSHMVAHNLRAPVARLLGLTRIFKQTPDEIVKAELADKIEKSASDFDAIIKDISMMLEVKKGMRFAMENVSLKNEIIHAIEFLEDEVKDNSAQIVMEVNESTVVYGMQPYIRSIFTNLIGNAIKYRDSKRIPNIKIISFEEKDFIKLHVIDNGLGIDLEKNGDKLFEPFKRFHAHKEGRGLGLHLVKSELEAMGGSIEAKSEIGQGTTFTFYFQKGKP